MTNAIKGLAAIVTMLAMPAVAVAAGRVAADADTGTTPATEKQTRTAEREVAISTYTCFSSAGNGEVRATIDYQGSSGVVAQTSGLNITVNTVIAPAEADAACAALTDGMLDLLTSLSCTARRVRLIGSTRDLVFVCTGNRTQVIDAVGLTAAFVAENVRTD